MTTMTMTHLVCPECGSHDIFHDVADWCAHSIEDPENTGTLVEFQCSDCGRSIWLGSDVFVPNPAAITA